MAKVGAKRAAELTGKSKSTMQRAMNSGKLSYELDANNRRVIDVSELERVFGLEKPAKDESQSTVEAELEKAKTMIEVERYKMRIQILEAQLDQATTQIDDLKAQRDQWQKQASQVLITSQFSQKQAEELKAELQMRKKQAQEKMRLRKEKVERKKIEDKMRKLRAENENANLFLEQDGAEDDGTFINFWRRIKGR